MTRRHPEAGRSTAGAVQEGVRTTREAASLPPSPDADGVQRRKPKVIPPPPPPNAVWLSIVDAAGYARVTRRTIEEARRRDPAFAALWRLMGELPRIRRAVLDQWIEGRGGWSAMGGRARGGETVGT
jgi:hypothetical protein